MKPPPSFIDDQVIDVQIDYPDVTFGITHYLRLDSLATCINSIHAFYPHARVDIQDTKGNLSWGRNQLIDRCDTKWLFLMEEDMAVLPQTNIGLLQSIMEDNPGLAGIGTGMIEKSAPRGRYNAAKIINHKGVITLRDSVELSQCGRFIWCDLLYNVGLFRVDFLRQFPWEVRLPFSEHDEFFWRVKQNSSWRFGCSRALVRHYRNREDLLYSKARMQRALLMRKEAKRLGANITGTHDWYIWNYIDHGTRSPSHRDRRIIRILNRVFRHRKQQTLRSLVRRTKLPRWRVRQALESGPFVCENRLWSVVSGRKRYAQQTKTRAR